MRCSPHLQMAMEEVSQISNPSGNGAAVPREVLLGFFLGQVRARLSFDTWFFLRQETCSPSRKYCGVAVLATATTAIATVLLCA